MTMSISWRLLIAVSLALLFTACPEDVEYEPIPGGEGDQGLTVENCDPQPVFIMVAPVDELTQSHADPLQMEIEVSNFAIVEKLGAAHEDCEGHFHVYIDEQYQGPIGTLTNSYDVSELDFGRHTFRVQVHQNDHAEYEGIPAMQIEFVTE